MSAFRPHDVRLHLASATRRIGLVAGLRAELDAPLVEEHLARRGDDQRLRSAGHQPAQKLLPEGLVRDVRVVLQHLPAPAPAGGEQRRPSEAVVLRHQQRDLSAAVHHRLGQHQRPGLRLADFLIVGQRRQLLPALGVLVRLFDQAADAGCRAPRASARPCAGSR